MSIITNRRVQYMQDGLYDRVRGDDDDFMDEESFMVKVNELVVGGLIETSTVEEDYTIYSAKHGLTWWSEFVKIVDTVKISILLLLAVNPKTFFVFLNTQKGKMRIAALEIKQWGQDRTKKVVAFIIVGNDKTLADQSVDGILKTFGEQKVRIFFLSSSSKTTFEDIKTYIDAYASDIIDFPEYPMPVIALLANEKQCEKKVRLQHHIHKKVVERNSMLRYGEIWDEADKTYKQLRDKSFLIDGQEMTCRTFTVEKTDALYRLGFISATDGELLDEDYPECANAYLYPIEIAQEDLAFYRALHHPQSITHRVQCATSKNNNAYATQIFMDNADHFRTPIILPTGEVYYRKIIVNSNAKTVDMRQFAKCCNNEYGMNAIVFNGYGGPSIKVYRTDFPVTFHKTKGKMFSELLFYIYKKLNLYDKPLVIIGRRKVDRGLGFHYCPRKNDTLTIEGDLGPLISKNREGLVWTDMILGRIEDKDNAVQKAGRLAGIIGNSPQYPGETHYWTDEYTENSIRRHNMIVDSSNETNNGCSVLEAVMNAEKMTPANKEINHRVDLDTFLVYRDEDTVRKVCGMLEYQYRCVKPSTAGVNIGFRETSVNAKKTKVSLLDAIRKVPTAYGTNDNGITWRTCIPCYENIEDKETLHFVIIVRPDILTGGGGQSAELKQMLINVKLQYPDIRIPQVA